MFIALPERMQLDLWSNGDWDNEVEMYVNEEDPAHDEETRKRLKIENDRIDNLIERVKKEEWFTHRSNYDSEQDSVTEEECDVSDYDFDALRDAARNERVLNEECRGLRKKIKILHAAVEWCGQKAGYEHPDPKDSNAWSKFLETQLLPSVEDK